jgi:hypothetical protein
MDNYPQPLSVKTNDGWKAAFWDPWYQDYVIKIYWRRPTKEEIEEDIKNGTIRELMPCENDGK